MKVKQLFYIATLILFTSCGHINVDEEYKKGISLYESKKYDEAIVALGKVIHHTDTCAGCFLYRGFALRKTERIKEAREDFTRLIGSKDEGDQKLGYVNRGGTFYDQRKYQLALRDYKKALKYEPENEAILNMISHMHFATNEKDSGCYYFWASMKIGETAFNTEIPKYCDSLAVESLNH